MFGRRFPPPIRFGTNSAGVFAQFAGFVVRYRWLVVLAWVLGVIAANRLLPDITTVTHSSNAQFLSPSSPSVQASRLAAPFRTVDPIQTATIVASRSTGSLSEADLSAMKRLEQTVSQVPGIRQIKDGGISPDGRATRATIIVPPEVSSSNTASDQIIAEIRATFGQSGPPSGLQIHLTGPLAVDTDSRSERGGGGITQYTLLFVIVVLFVVYRALLAPLITLIPAALAVIISGRLIASIMGGAGIAVPPSTQPLLVVLLLGAGTDYGLFLCFRFREELVRRGDARAALIMAESRVGQAITFSGLIVASALLTMLLAPSGIYQGIGPSLAIGITVMLGAALTLMPALLAIFGKAAFWPVLPKPGPVRVVLWGRVAEYVVRRPRATLGLGLVLFGALAAGLIGFHVTSELSSAPPPGSDSATGAKELADHFPPPTQTDQLLLRYATPADVSGVVSQTRVQLAGASVFQTVSDPQFSPDGETVLFPVVLGAGPVGSPSAADAVPLAENALAAVGRETGAQAYGIAGPDASLHDVLESSNLSLIKVVPALLILILLLLAAMLRSLVAPIYLALTVGLSYLSSLGFAMIAFVHLGGAKGLVFILPLLMFVFSMALGEDYNVLVMSRIREEAQPTGSLPEALTRAIGITGTTVTAAGIILAGAFVVLGFAGGSSQTQQLGLSVAFSVLLDTFFVRTLLVPSIATILGRWNWWPSALSRAVE